ncbi:MAG: hypothetical protein LIO46_04755, partial [Clostridiales bacterium]|nr:hypothetical protein [Clostridiales bacterium]
MPYNLSGVSARLRTELNKSIAYVTQFVQRKGKKVVLFPKRHKNSNSLPHIPAPLPHSLYRNPLKEASAIHKLPGWAIKIHLNLLENSRMIIR